MNDVTIDVALAWKSLHKAKEMSTAFLPTVENTKSNMPRHASVYTQSSWEEKIREATYASKRLPEKYSLCPF
ncbi:prefoldin subunit 4 [Platysternon megacephalum]|uniref:Prefoldin subunit 4 n=1 Tax=Platysternon megacephalum TaxID=55544 RepID=A0A4D9ECG5_9SAUR|nr:prefoldin subunit 4 [Platysternon megacephalum]